MPSVRREVRAAVPSGRNDAPGQVQRRPGVATPSIVAAALALPLAVYASVGAFSRYTADDFCWAGTLRVEGFFNGQVSYYMNYSPRYAFTFLVNVVEAIGPAIVPALPAAAIVGWLAVLTWTFRQFGIARLRGFLLAETAVFAALQTAPDLPQSLYWQTGMLTYVLPLVLATFLIGWIRRADRRWWALGVSALVTFVGGGLSETYLIPQNVALTLALLVAIWLTWRTSRWASARDGTTASSPAPGSSNPASASGIGSSPGSAPGTGSCANSAPGVSSSAAFAPAFGSDVASAPGAGSRVGSCAASPPAAASSGAESSPATPSSPASASSIGSNQASAPGIGSSPDSASGIDSCAASATGVGSAAGWGPTRASLAAQGSTVATALAARAHTGATAPDQAVFADGKKVVRVPSSRSVLAHLTAALAGGVLALVVILIAPATASRVGGTPADLWLALSAAIATAAFQVARLVRYFAPTIVLCLALPALVGSCAPRIERRWFVVVTAVVAVTLPFCYFPSFYAQNGNPPARSLMVPGAILIGYVLFVGFSLRRVVERVPEPRRALATLVVALVPLAAAVLSTPEVASAARYAALFDAEDRQIRASRDAGQLDLTVPPLPPNFGEGFVTADRQNWFNVCVARYYGLRSIATPS